VCRNRAVAAKGVRVPGIAASRFASGRDRGAGAGTIDAPVVVSKPFALDDLRRAGERGDAAGTSCVTLGRLVSSAPSLRSALAAVLANEDR
jgi:hypothetical protein